MGQCEVCGGAHWSQPMPQFKLSDQIISPCEGGTRGRAMETWTTVNIAKAEEPAIWNTTVQETKRIC